MVNKKFECYKIEREIKRSGQSYIFNRLERNGFKELTGNIEVVKTIQGLYHEQNSAIQITTGDTTQIRTKKIPMILCLFDETKELQVEDVVAINGKTFRVTGVVNIQEWNIIADISLEVSDYVIQN